ncbi:NAD(P)-binding protein [Mycena albidolilacea]|uniref:NAD(P)-binding protein n=1 Tax=Mycena albidolilacea TaxID=1033008 RepID=A0AAD7EP06_9AGAR|nr:NAD(P)-binding protein [Mycena albidolilacea]
MTDGHAQITVTLALYLAFPTKMTISKDPSATLVTVVGATGTQGGSVINALVESDKPYRVWGFTRDAAKPAAQELVKLGVEVVVVSLVVENKEELVTNFWEHVDVEKVVWSGLPSFNKLSSGKYANIYHFDGKAVITEYGRQSGIQFADVQAGFYGQNFQGNTPSMLAKQADGSFVIALPVKPTAIIPFIDAVHDYGLFVRQVLEDPVFPDGSQIVAHGGKITYPDLAQQLSQVTEKKVVFQQISVEQFKKGVQVLALPPHIALDMLEFMLAWDEFGWGDAAPIQKGLARRPRTWTEFAKNSDWSKAC